LPDADAGPGRLDHCGRLPAIVYVVLVGYVVIGTLLVLGALLSVRRWRKRSPRASVPLARTQLTVWVVLVVGGILLCVLHPLPVGVILLLLALLLPRGVKVSQRETNA